MAPLRIAFISNLSTERCGVRAFGAEMVDAIRRAGHHVEEWDGTYSVAKEKGYLPYEQIQAGAYDLLHLNWDPQAINHYLPEHFPRSFPPLSLFLHDVPPNSTCPVMDVARWRFGFEPYAGVQVVPEGIPPTPDDREPFYRAPGPIIGVSGIRNDPGMAMVADVCRAERWTLNTPSWWSGGPWLSTEDEIRRLMRSSVNVCWYHTSGRGKSMAACFCLASRRPLVCSGSTMFSALWPYSDEITFAYEPATSVGALTDAIKRALEKPPATRVLEELSWDRVIEPVIAAWQGGLL